MADDFALQVSDLSKCYRVFGRPSDRLKQAVVPRLLGALGMRRGGAGGPRYFDEFWALRDISFDVQRGEAFGVIGRNGAGKSTLLQLIAGTLAPTSGSVRTRGRVVALLELGSGFNTEFTGRENVALTASLYGLSRSEFDARFDDIAAFADIGEFLDQPVKTYSSGMMVRLAFSVLTALDPELLIVDEALSVGDVFFQAKCMTRMRQLIARGTTLLFVSHDTASVRQLCDRAILLEHGRALALGPARDVADQYLKMEVGARNDAAGAPAVKAAAPAGAAAEPARQAEASRALGPCMDGAEQFGKRAGFERSGNGGARFLNVQMLAGDDPAALFEYGAVARLRQVVRFERDIDNVDLSYKIRTPQGVNVVFGDLRLHGKVGRRYRAGEVCLFEWTLPLTLLHGNYTVMSALAQPPSDAAPDWVFLDVVPISCIFAMAPRREGMIDGFVTWSDAVQIESLDADR
jgi:lipopolysaccharide transport system ATP-binding protein